MIQVAIISSGRPSHVLSMASWFEEMVPIWYVPAEQKGEYELYGACVRPVDGELPMKSRQLNAALSDAADILVTLDDDLKALRINEGEGWHRCSVDHAVKRMLRWYNGRETLIGPAPTGISLHLKGKPPVVHDRYPAGQFAIHLQPDKFRYDEGLVTSEDWDFFLQHFDAERGVTRVNTVMAPFDMLQARGGFQAHDRSALDLASRQQLAKKWPQYVTWPSEKRGCLDIDVRVNGHSAR